MRPPYSAAMNTRSLLRILAALAVLGSLGGCASLSKSECLSANWEDVGIRDGADGRPEEYLIQHSKACSKVSVEELDALGTGRAGSSMKCRRCSPSTESVP